MSYLAATTAGLDPAWRGGQGGSVPFPVSGSTSSSEAKLVYI